MRSRPSSISRAHLHRVARLLGGVGLGELLLGLPEQVADLRLRAARAGVVGEADGDSDGEGLGRPGRRLGGVVGSGCRDDAVERVLDRLAERLPDPTRPW